MFRAEGARRWTGRQRSWTDAVDACRHCSGAGPELEGDERGERPLVLLRYRDSSIAGWSEGLNPGPSGCHSCGTCEPALATQRDSDFTENPLQNSITSSNRQNSLAEATREEKKKNKKESKVLRKMMANLKEARRQVSNFFSSTQKPETVLSSQQPFDKVGVLFALVSKNSGGLPFELSQFIGRMALEPLLIKEREQRHEAQSRLAVGLIRNMTTTAMLLGAGSLSAEDFHNCITYLTREDPDLVRASGLEKYFLSVEESINAQDAKSCLTGFIELYKKLYIIRHQLQDASDIPAAVLLPFQAFL
jgi:hypothetical protein